MERKHKVCMMMVAYRDKLPPFERMSAEQYRRILPDVPVKLLTSDAVGDKVISGWGEALGGLVEVVRIPRKWLASHNAYNALCFEPWLYRLFSDYEYILTAQTDGWINYDALDWWASQDCDFIAPPYFYDDCGTFRNLQERRGGNGGTCLRRTETFIRYTEEMKKRGINPRWCWEDQVYSGALPYHQRKVLPAIRYYPFMEQARFGWTSPGEGWHEPELMFRLTGGVLPMLFHKPTQAFSSRFCIPDEPPEDVFLFSSVVGGDYLAAVRAVNADPSSRLLVGFNANKALLETESGRALLADGPCNLLTMHNETVERLQGFAGKADTVIGLRDAKFEGRHRMLCIRWRTPKNADDISATHDGEILAPAETEVLRSITVEETAPTVGYVGYRIIRSRYPDARIHLVNFLGGSKAHPVCVRHDTRWEQEAYRMDGKVDFITTVKE